ncbi:MAG TPA: hypothetical protein VKZ42_06210 [Flavobacteriaceae bacterium]|nr:hypothetical protein [Flavobacteriaceae bacterium]
MIIVVAKNFIGKQFQAMTLYPFVFLKNNSLREDSVLLYHEKIHLRQQAEMLVVFFYLWYGIEFLVRFVQYKKRHVAYHNISLEREAYQHENNFGYLQQRKLWNFLSFLVKKK